MDDDDSRGGEDDQPSPILVSKNTDETFGMVTDFRRSPLNPDCKDSTVKKDGPSSTLSDNWSMDELVSSVVKCKIED